MNVEQEFKQFVEFGHIFDKSTRRELVRYLKTKLYEPSSLKDNELAVTDSQEGWITVLDKIFTEDKLLRVTVGNEALATQIIHDTLLWMRRSQNEINKNNPCQEEFGMFQSWRDRPLRLWAETWYHLTNFLKEAYTREQLDVSFYEYHFDPVFRDRERFYKEIEGEGEDTHPVNRLVNDLLRQWEILLVQKSLQYEMQEIQEKMQAYSELLYAKASEYEKMVDLLEPFAQEVGRFWNMSRGLWKQTNFDVLQKYRELLKNEDSIRELADLLGRMREAQIEIEHEQYEYAIAKATYRPSLEESTEIGGVYESNNLNYLLPAETVLLGDTETEMAFYKKYIDNGLLTFQFQGREIVKGEGSASGNRELIRRKHKGPFIICVDASASMEGTPEYVAKVCCFAILQMAAREKRSCYLISFSTGLHTINLLELENSMDQLVKFLSMTFNGGTDIHPPMYEALTMLQTHNYKEADVLMISDFIMYEMQDPLLKRIRQEQQKGTHFHSLTVHTGTDPNIRVVEVFDNYWIYNPESKEIGRQLAVDLQKINVGIPQI
ncbi:VWA domain-containing protein [Cytophagaceae bacterium YF14B1]|uniref:VWA domain-containing protein n=1 Tax=Xanthocytophaga flava TaxID=3048013 RepID=A0AAE3QMF1_9BACT|nr:VWA domain-containing protein [Xanthocytophaga flavus]MDJ1482037.1 VWA domain-containing protein [Xanthocytophaga flavus]